MIFGTEERRAAKGNNLGFEQIYQEVTGKNFFKI